MYGNSCSSMWQLASQKRLSSMILVSWFAQGHISGRNVHHPRLRTELRSRYTTRYIRRIIHAVKSVEEKFSGVLTGIELRSSNYVSPITVAACSKAWKVFASSNTVIVASNPTQGTDVCVYSVFVCRYRPCDVLLPRLRSPTEFLRLRNWSETKSFTNARCSKWEQQE
jgi:hypothetical protein